MAAGCPSATVNPVPEYALEEVRALIAASERDATKVDYTYYDKSIGAVSERLSLSARDAEGYIIEKVLSLTESDYRATSPTPPPPADIYEIDTIDNLKATQRTHWFIKFKVIPAVGPQDKYLELWSFHPSVS